MQEAGLIEASQRAPGRLRPLTSRARAALPTLAETACAVASAILLLLAFPDFGVWPLAWVAFVPLLFAVVRRPCAAPSFLTGWLAGTTFFYFSCHWLTYPMIRYAEFPSLLAHVLLLPAALAGGFFTALFALALARLCSRWGAHALFLAPPVWAATEWARLGVIGQLWNAVGYSQAPQPQLIQAARFGGVYAVGFLVLAVNAAIAFALFKRHMRLPLAVYLCVQVALVIFNLTSPAPAKTEPSAVVVAVQPNVMPDFNRRASEYEALAARHFELSTAALRANDSALPHVIVWPESPMNFSFEGSSDFRERVVRFVREQHASLLFNSLEPTGDGGGFNAAVMVNEEGRVAAQYDKIRLMPFGEYVPLPRWLPGADAVRGVVGDFTPGTRYTLMPLGKGEAAPRAGVFICLESAYPFITRRFADEGADVLIEITNDAYQGDTAVMRQHLSNAVFRAVETGRPLLRVTNTGISARITPRGEVEDETGRFQEAVRTWTVARSDGGKTFYVRFGDAFVAACTIVGLFAIALTLRGRKFLTT